VHASIAKIRAWSQCFFTCGQATDYGNSCMHGNWCWLE